MATKKPPTRRIVTTPNAQTARDEKSTQNPQTPPPPTQRARPGFHMQGFAATCSIALALLTGTSMASAGQATTSASAGQTGRGPGTATAGAAYNGNGPGFAQTRTRSGPVSMGQGVAFGMDRNGVSFSASQAVAGPLGPAVASTFNLTVGFNGRVSGSQGRSIAGGSRSRQASAGGSAGMRHGRPRAMSRAGGRTGSRGFVRATTRSRTTRMGSMRPRGRRVHRPRWR